MIVTNRTYWQWDFDLLATPLVDHK